MAQIHAAHTSLAVSRRSESVQPRLDPETVALCEQRLLREEAELSEFLEQDRAALKIEPGLEHGDHINGMVLRANRFNTSVGKLADVRAALGRIKAGTFGICCDCNHSVHPDRIVAYPHVSRCTGCQAKHATGRAPRIW